MIGTMPCASVLVAGSANVDFVVRAPHIPAPGETVLGRDLEVVPGGKGANQAVASARAGGVATAMLVALGNDLFAPLLEESLLEAGVVLHKKVSQAPTGAALICVSDDAENAIAVAPGANSSLAAEDLPDLSGFDTLILQLETPLRAVTAYAVAARGAGVRVILNAAPAQALPPDLLAAVNILVVNEEELRAVAGRGGSIAELLTGLNLPCVVATLGSRGACMLDRDGFHLQSAFPVEPVDTTAAGDTFCGVFAAALSGGHDSRDGLRTACAAAALATTRSGAQSSIPTHSEIETFLAERPTPWERDSDLAVYCGLPADPRFNQDES